MGIGKQVNLVYLIDFGLSKEFRNLKTYTHILYKKGLGLVGTRIRCGLLWGFFGQLVPLPGKTCAHAYGYRFSILTGESYCRVNRYGGFPLGNIMGHPGFFSGNLHPYPAKPVPVSTGTGFPFPWVWVTAGLTDLTGSCGFKFSEIFRASIYYSI